MDRHRAALRVPAALRARSVWVGLALLALGAVDAGCGREGPPGESYEIVGFVVESVGEGTDGPGIGGAMVRFESDTGRTVETVSEGNGRYRIYVLSETRFGQVTASAPGYGEARETVFFDSPQRRLDLALPRLEPEP
jgi:hypothetical protein